jgi:hypothetical protein
MRTKVINQTFGHGDFGWVVQVGPEFYVREKAAEYAEAIHVLITKVMSEPDDGPDPMPLCPVCGKDAPRRAWCSTACEKADRGDEPSGVQAAPPAPEAGPAGPTHSAPT